MENIKNFFNKNFLTNSLFYFIIIISGIIWGIGQYPDFFFIRYFGLIPFIFIVINRRRYIIESILFGSVAYIMNFYWLYVTFKESGKLPVVLAVALPAVLSVYYGLQYPIIAFIYKKFYSFNKNVLFYSLPFVFVLVDSLYIKIFKHSIADSQIGFNIFVQNIDITGMTGLIITIMLLNLGLFNLIDKILNKNRVKIAHFLFLIPFVISLVYGSFRLAYLNKQIPKCDTVVGAMIQGNVTGKQKLDENYFKTNVERYNELTKSASKGDETVDLIIWPESIFNRAYHGRDDFLRKVITDNYPPLILGIVVWLDESNITNSALLIENRKKTAQYDKERLLMFGEYIPMEKTFPFLRKLTPLSKNSSPGKTSSIFTIKNVKASINICFEEIFPDLIRKKCAEGSNLLINLTNDSWFGNGLGPLHHSVLGRLRAIENRRSFFRCTATGLTTASDFTGKIIAKGSMATAEVVKAEVPLYEKRSIYSYIGEIFTNVSIFMVIITALYLIRRRYEMKKILSVVKNRDD